MTERSTYERCDHRRPSRMTSRCEISRQRCCRDPRGSMNCRSVATWHWQTVSYRVFVYLNKQKYSEIVTTRHLDRATIQYEGGMYVDVIQGPVTPREGDTAWWCCSSPCYSSPATSPETSSNHKKCNVIQVAPYATL